MYFVHVRAFDKDYGFTFIKDNDLNECICATLEVDQVDGTLIAGTTNSWVYENENIRIVVFDNKDTRKVRNETLALLEWPEPDTLIDKARDMFAVKEEDDNA